MGTSSSRIKNVPMAEELMQETGFSAAHILRLYERFQSLDQENAGHLRPDDLEVVGELAMNPIGGRIISAFFPPGQDLVDFPFFVRILAHFRPASSARSRDGVQREPSCSRTGKLKFAFQLYDQNNDGKIQREDLLQVLRAMLGIQVTEEQLKSIADRALEEADLDRDGAISFNEFMKSLEKVDVENRMSTSFLK